MHMLPTVFERRKEAVGDTVNHISQAQNFNHVFSFIKVLEARTFPLTESPFI